MTKSQLSGESSININQTVGAILKRCEEIIIGCDNGTVVNLFSPREIRTTCKLCLNFMAAVSKVKSADELRAEHELISRLEDAVITANIALTELTRENPLVIATIRMCEETLFRLLREGDATVLVLAGLGCKFRPVVKQALHAFFTDIRRQLETKDNAKAIGKLAQSLASPLTTILIRKIKPVLAESGEKLVTAVSKELRRTKKELRHDYKHPEQISYGCHHDDTEKDKIVQLLIRNLAVPGVTFSIHAACATLFGKDHAITHGWLYDWCHNHEREIQNEVEYLRHSRS